MIETPEVGMKVKFTKNGKVIEGKITSVENLKGFRGYAYQLLYVKCENETYTVHMWDAILLN